MKGGRWVSAGVVEIDGTVDCQLTKIRLYSPGKGESTGISEGNSNMLQFVLQED